MSSIDDILASMKAAAPAAASTAPPLSHSWTESTPSITATTPPLDARHRVAATGASDLDYRFRCGKLRVSKAEAAALQTDCAMVFMLNSSNWLAATAEPRCSLERLAKAIFDKHTAGIAFDPKTSGAEWWAQVREGGQPHEGIEFHWDVDEHFCDIEAGHDGVHVHPHLSTVTYLSEEGGAPTVILHARCPTDATPGAVAKVYGPLSAGAVSWPRLGKTIVFDGSDLHGAVPPRGEGCPSGLRRVTFLVNVWLGHRPHAVEPLPASLARSISGAWAPHPQLGAFNGALEPPPSRSLVMPHAAGEGPSQQQGGGAEADPAAGPTARSIQVAFGRNDKVHALRLLLPPKEERADSLRLSFGHGAAEVGPNTSGLRCDRSGPRKQKADREGRARDEGASSSPAGHGAQRKKPKVHAASSR